jgi:uncharacterized protein (DUF1015 family)
MAVIRAFQGLRFSEDAGSIDALTAPPYDVLTPEDREEFAVRSKHNIVHLTLPTQHEDDRSKFVKYARSGAQLAEWRRSGALLLEDKPAIYRYTQSFSLPRVGEAYRRTSIIALIKVEPYEKGVVLPHEQTFPKHKEDRLRILEATRSHLECIFGLYEDPNGEVLDAIAHAPAGAKVEARSEDGVHHELEPITDEATLQRIIGQMADKKVWIADGHHRYETALTFRQSLGERDELVAEDFMMMALTSMSDPGLVLLPTHRVLAHDALDPNLALTQLEPYFHMELHHSRGLWEHMVHAQEQGKRAFALALEGGQGYLLTPKDDAALLAMNDSNDTDALKSLDVTVLHRIIFEQILGVTSLEGITYTRDWQEAIRLADQGASAAFLMNPPSVDDMKDVALNGEKMPQKSTYYFPKILSGLVVWSLADF